MINKVLNAVEGFAFDAVMATAMPLLVWWCTKGLKNHEYTEELVEFWTAYWTPIPETAE